jgi:hypothetical protein
MTEWDSIASHTLLTKSADFQEALAIIGPVLDGPPSIHHASMDASYSKVLKAPITEILTLYQPGETIESDLADVAAIYEKVDGFHGASSGAVVEELNFGDEKLKAYQVVAGWDSMKAHEEAFKSGEVVAKLGSALAFQVAKGKEVHHVKFMSG